MTTFHARRTKVTVADLQKCTNKVVIISYESDDADDETGLKVFEGKIKGVGEAGVALANRNTSIIIEISSIVDFEVVARQRRVIRRHLRVLTESDLSVRQHLADRHGLQVDILNAVDEETARTMHDKIDHKLLGHDHVTKDQQDEMLDSLGESTDDEDDD